MLARLRVVQDRVPCAERAARTILTRQSDWNPFQQQRSEGEGFGVMPFIWATVFEDFALMIEHDAFDLRLNLKTLWSSSEAIDNGFKRFLTDRSRLRLAGVIRLKNRRRFLELCFFAGLPLFN